MAIEGQLSAEILTVTGSLDCPAIVKKRILLVDGHPEWRWQLRSALLSQIDFEVVGEANDGLDAGVLLSELQPNLLLIDISIYGRTSIKTIRNLRDRFPEIDILVVTIYEMDGCLFEMCKAGIDGYLLKTASLEEYCVAIRSIADERPLAFRLNAPAVSVPA